MDVNAPSTNEVETGGRKSVNLVLAFSVLSASLTMGYGVLFTIVDDYKNDYGLSSTAIGVVIGIGFLAGFLSQIFIAPLADRGYARRVVVFGVLVNVIGLLLMAAGTTLTPILVGRFVSGIGIGAATPAIRRIVVLVDQANLGRNLGRLFAADVFGFALGPAISAVLVGPFGIPSPFIVVAGITLLLLPILLGVDLDDRASDSHQRLALDLLKIRPFAGAVVFGATAFLMIGAFDALWAQVHDELGTNEWIANLGITLFALPLIVLGAPGGRLAQRVGPFKIAAAGLLAAAFFMFTYGILPTGMAIFAVAMVHACADGFTFTSTGIAASMTVPDARQAGAQGVLGAAQSVMAGTMAMVTGTLYDQFGRTVAYSVSAGAMVTLIAIGTALARSSWGMNQSNTADGVINLATPMVRGQRKRVSGR